jgi:hypothetical protein
MWHGHDVTKSGQPYFAPDHPRIEDPSAALGDYIDNHTIARTAISSLTSAPAISASPNRTSRRARRRWSTWNRYSATPRTTGSGGGGYGNAHSPPHGW